MAFARRFVRHPRSTAWWRFNFFLHAVLGALLTVYLAVIGASGSVLVFRNELQAWGNEGLRFPYSRTAEAKLSMEQAIAFLRQRYPQDRLLSIHTPTRFDPCYEATMLGPRDRIRLAVHAQTGAIIERKNTVTFLHILGSLHATLLAGRNGRIANGVGAFLLLAINGTGLVIWWSGPKLWLRSLRVDFRRNWRRINFDAHRAIGFWTVTVVTFWALSAIYFAWPEAVTRAIDRVSPLSNAKPPVVHLPHSVVPKPAPVSGMIESALRIDPGAVLAGIQFPYSRSAPFEVLMQRKGGEGAAYTDVIYFNPQDGAHLWTWRYGVGGSWGDFLIWLQIPLHFGTAWGLPFKILWASIGLALPILALSGAFLYWNRVLRHLWASSRTRRHQLPTALPAGDQHALDHHRRSLRDRESSTAYTWPADRP